MEHLLVLISDFFNSEIRIESILILFLNLILMHFLKGITIAFQRCII